MRLLTFGDSWTAGHGIEEDEKYRNNGNPQYDKGFMMRLRNSNSWPRWLSDKLNCPFVNSGYCGYNNHEILNEVKLVTGTDLLDKNDIIVVMFSYPHRNRNENNFKNLMEGNTNKILHEFNEFEKILSPYKHFYFNAFYPIFKDELGVDMDKIPNYFINKESSVADVLKKYEIENDISIWNYGDREIWEDEKTLWEGKHHPNLLGYKIIAEHMYQEIKNFI